MRSTSIICVKAKDQSGLSVPNRTVPYIPPSIRFGSRSKIPSGEAIRLANVRYGSVRFEDVRYGEPSLRKDVWRVEDMY